MNKKGLSQIIATVLLILLTVSAAVFIANFLVPWYRGQLDSTECFTYRDYFSFEDEFGYNCYKKNTPNNYLISVTAKTELNETQQNVVGFGLALLSGGESIVLTVMDNTLPSGIFMNSNLSANLTIPKSGEVRTYYHNNSMVFESAKIYPILKSGRKCEASNTIKLAQC